MLDDLEIRIDVNTDEIAKAMRSLKGGLGIARSQAKKVSDEIALLTNRFNAIAKLSDAGLAKAMEKAGKSAKDMPALRAQLKSTTDMLSKAASDMGGLWQDQRSQIDKTIRELKMLDESVTQPAAQQAAERLSDQFSQLAIKVEDIKPVVDSTTAKLTSSANIIEADFRRIETQLEDSTRQLRDFAAVQVQRPPSFDASSKPSDAPTGAPGFKAAALVAGAAAFQKVSKVVGTVSRNVTGAINGINSSVGRFRLASMAGKADKSLNFVGNLFRNTTQTIAQLIDAVTKRIDAAMSDIGGSIRTASGGLGQVMAALQRAFLMITKHVDRLQQRMNGANFAATFLPFVRSMRDLQNNTLQPIVTLLERVANGLNKVIQLGGRAEAELATAAGLAGAGWQKTSGVVQEYADSLKAAAIPARLMARELEGGTRVANTARAGWALLTTPVVAVKNAIVSASTRHRMFNAILSGQPLTLQKLGQAHINLSAALKPMKLQTLGQAYINLSAALNKVAAEGSQVRAVFDSVKQTQQQVFQGVQSGASAGYARLAQAINIVIPMLRPFAAGLKLVFRGLLAIARLLSRLLPSFATLRSIMGRVAGVAGSLTSGLFGAARSATRMTRTMVEAGSSARKLTTSLVNTQEAAKSAGAGIRRVFMFPRDMASGLLRTLGNMKMALVAAAGAAATWGARTAIAAETSQTKFATMLQSGEQAQALLKQIEDFSAATPFANSDLQEAAQQLLVARIPANQITDQLKVLGDVAAGTGKPIIEFARIMAKVRNTGKVSGDVLTQLAERGVPIYQELSKQLGVAQNKIAKMASEGKIGFKQLESAVAATTTGSGLFADGMKKLSGTTAGLLSTLKDNVQLLFRDMSSALMDALGFKDLVSGATTVFQTIRTQFNKFKGLVTTYGSMVRTVWSAAWDAAKTAVMSTFGSIGKGKGTLQALAESAVIVMARIKSAFHNWRDVAKYATLRVRLGMISLTENLRTIWKAFMDWLPSSWSDMITKMIATTAGLGDAIRRQLGVEGVDGAIDRLADEHGLTKAQRKDLKGLGGAINDRLGNNSTAEDKNGAGTSNDLLASLNQALKTRPITDAEKKLGDELKALGDKLKEASDATVADELDKFRRSLENVKLPDLNGGDGDDDDDDDDADNSSSKQNGRTSFLVEERERGSVEALRAVFDNRREDPNLAVNKQILEELKKHRPEKPKNPPVDEPMLMAGGVE